ncbi:MBL fold metallo-hydrolase [Bacteroides ihuae]|uniref:MBL fold metallo-hydrolase n=1 Tax=Bacteroides ihuae TaxID=1852362 RepID=UPI00098F2267|nr:MBL fold metallo-hydrolase [Bacteroides ihuae]
MAKAYEQTNFAGKNMKRRTAIKLGALLSGALAIPTLMSNTLPPTETNKKQPNCGYVKINGDKFELYIFSDGHMLLENPQPIFAPQINSTTFTTELKRLYLGNKGIDLAINIMVIKINNKTILIDSGMGNHFGESQGWLLENLQNAGINANSITDILITHAHRDHIGGLITKSNTIVYPNAQYHIAKAEYEFWTSENPDFSKSKLTDEQKKGTIAFPQKILNIIKEKLNTFTPGDTLFSFINTELAEGHTPGHTIFTISSEGKSIKNIVDTFHSPLLITNPEWGIEFDINFEQGIKTRMQILEDCYINKRLVMSSHLPWPGLGYIDKREKYYWVPLYYSTPTEIKL